MKWADEWKKFAGTFKGISKLVFVAIPTMLAPLANWISTGLGGDDLIPLGQYGALAAVIAPVLAAFVIVVLFQRRNDLERLLTIDLANAEASGQGFGWRLFLFFILPLTLFAWGISGIVIINVGLGGSIFAFVAYILSFTFLALGIGLLTMREYLWDRINQASGTRDGQTLNSA